jgi:hypothetical protein
MTTLALQGLRRWVYILPSIHLCACLISYSGYVIPSLQNLAILFPFILLADLPVSIVTYSLGWKYPSIAVLWIFVGGTLWWYLLSRGVDFLFNIFRSPKS